VLSWQAMILNGFFRFTMKRHGKMPLNLGRWPLLPGRSARAMLPEEPMYRRLYG
jgi:hypothetical protein